MEFLAGALMLVLVLGLLSVGTARTEKPVVVVLEDRRSGLNGCLLLLLGLPLLLLLLLLSQALS